MRVLAFLQPATNVNTVGSVLGIVALYSDTFGFIQGLNHTSVSTVANVSVGVATYSATFG